MSKPALEVLAYFLQHPDQVESLEGLVRWRLGVQRISRTVDEVGAALSWLVAEGFLHQELSATSEPLFSFNREQETKARGLMDDL